VSGANPNTKPMALRCRGSQVHPKLYEMKMQVVKTIYYLTAIVFHWVLFFTYIGNYFHGGTPFEKIALDITNVLIVVASIKLIPKVRTIEKVFVILCAIIPIIYLAGSLIFAIKRIVSFEFSE
jgi:hypothetical protein